MNTLRNYIQLVLRENRKGVPPMSMGEAKLRTFVKKILAEGGHAFPDVTSIKLEDFEAVWPSIQSDLKSLGCKEVEKIGSTGKKPLMGDVDLAASCDVSRDEMFAAAVKKFGAQNVAKVGGNIVTISYPVPSSGQHVQVDVMLGKTDFLKWSRFGTSTIEGHEDFSHVKGVARNILIAAIANEVSAQKIGSSSDPLVRTRFALDFDNGLFKTTQSKQGKDPNKPLSSWKTLDREFVTDDPDEVAEFLFGKGFTSHDVKTLESTVDSVVRSPMLRHKARKIFDEFYEGAKRFLATKPGSFGGKSDEEVLEYLQGVLA